MTEWSELTALCFDFLQVDKGHCKIDYDGDADLEYADFYDFRPSYPDYKEGEAGAEGEDEELPADDAK